MMRYTERFQTCVAIILENEGGYVNDPQDAGGETNFGISKRAFPDLDIKNLSIEEAISIYHKKYWSPIKGDYIVGADLAFQVFDMAVNAGISVAVKILQSAVGTHVDGIIGPATLNAIYKYPSIEGLLWRYKFDRAKYYAKIVSKNHSQAKFLMGWINRINKTI